MTPPTVPEQVRAHTEGEAGVATTGKPPGWRQGTMGELVAEFIGTAIIILFGCGSVAMTVAALNQSDRGKEALVASGDWLLITTGWGVGVALAVWVAGGVSGAHLNPAVTLAQALRRGFPWGKVPSYDSPIGPLIDQILGTGDRVVVVEVDQRGAREGAQQLRRPV